MAGQDPKYLKEIVTALVDGIDKETAAKHAHVIDHLKKYIEAYSKSGELTEMLPKWRGAVEDELENQLTPADEKFIESGHFRMFETEGWGILKIGDPRFPVLVGYAEQFENAQGLTADQIKGSIVPLRTELEMIYPTYNGMFGSLEKKLNTIAGTPGAAQQQQQQVDQSTGSTPTPPVTAGTPITDNSYLDAATDSILEKSGITLTPALKKNIEEYKEKHKDNLAEALPKWRDEARKALAGDAESLKVLNDKRFDFLESANLQKVLKLTKDVSDFLVRTAGLDEESTQTKVDKFITDAGVAQVGGVVEAIKAYASKVYTNLNPTATKTDTKTKTEAEKTEEEIKGPFADEKREAQRLLDEGQKILGRMEGYKGEIPGDKRGAGEILQDAEKDIKVAQYIIKELKGDNLHDQADGIDNVLTTSLLPSLDKARETKEELEERYEQSSQNHKDEILKLKDSIFAVTKESQAGEVNDALAKLKDHVQALKGEETAARTILVDTAKHINAARASLTDKNEYKYFTGPDGSLAKGAMDLEGSKYGIVNQFLVGDADGSPSLLGSGFNAIKAGASKLWKGWESAGLNAKTQTGRNIHNIATHTMMGLGGLFLLNTVNNIFFNNQMPTAVKWGILGVMTLALLRRSGVWGEKMVSAAKGRMSYGQSDSSSHMPRKPIADDGRIVNRTGRTTTGTATEAGKAANTNALAITAKDDTEFAKKGDVVKDIAVIFEPDGNVRVQGHKGGMFKDLNKDGVIDIKEIRAAKGFEVNVPEKLKQDLIAKAEERYNKDIVQPYVNARLSGTGESTPLKELAEGMFDGTFKVTKVGNDELGQNAINATYYVHKGVISNAVDENMPHSPTEAVGQ